MVYSELGRCPLKYTRTYNMIKYWSKLLVSSNCILKSCYEYMYDRVENYWVSFIKQELLSLGFGEVWVNQCTNKSHLVIIKQRIFDQSQQTISELKLKFQQNVYYISNYMVCFVFNII